MTSTNRQSAYIGALDAAREELVQISAKLNWLLARQDSLKVAAETLEALLESNSFPQAESLPNRTIETANAPSVSNEFAPSAPAPSPIEHLVESSDPQKAAVQELPTDPILRRIHGALDLVAVS
ncbi:MAG: hypothetical protein KGN79_12145 [Acidobacteriota bacterium]|nr:hypothetical protein [Acidobacteriota bacterium]